MGKDVSKLVLVVEHDPAIGELITEVLEGDGYHTCVVRNAGSALEFLATIRPHLILTSLMLPGLSGEQLLALLRAQPTTHDIPVVVMTGLSAPPMSVTQQANAILTKPFVLDTLLNVVTQVLAGDMLRNRSLGA